MNTKVEKLPTAADWYQKQREVSAIISSRNLAWRGIEVAEVCHSVVGRKTFEFETHVIVFHVGNIPVSGTIKLNGKTYPVKSSRGTVGIHPSNTPYICEFKGIKTEKIFLNLTPQFIRQTAVKIDLNPDKVELVPQFLVHDKIIECLALDFQNELRTKQNGNRLLADALTTNLAVHLLRNYCAVKMSNESVFRGGLSPSLFRRVADYIEANLTEDISLKDIASVCGLNEYYFLRAFRRTIGLTPHQYVINKRIERARELLKDKNLSITAIAYSLGFSTPSHFADTFRRLIGLTPREYRQ